MDVQISLFEFQDYRAFLKAWIEKAKSLRVSNLSQLSQVCGVHPTFLSHVLSGTKELSLEQASLMSEYFGFTQLEQDYFFSIIQMERAGHFKLKEYFQNKISHIESEKNKLSKRFDKHKQLTTEQKAIFYSSWIYASIWSSTDINGGQTIDEVSTRFKISREQAQTILSFLVQAGLCIEEQGIYRLGDSHIHVSNESHFVVKHHLNFRIKSMQKMDTRDGSELFFTAPMSISKSDFKIIREKLNLIVKEIVEVAKDSKSDQVTCLNIDFFKVE